MSQLRDPFGGEDILDRISGAGTAFKPLTLAQMQKQAREQGYTLDPSGMSVSMPLGRRSTTNTPGFTNARITTPLTALFGGGYQPMGLTGPGMTSLLGDALGQDVRAQQAAADEQFRRNQAEIEGLRSFLGDVGGDIAAGRDQGIAELRGMAGRADALGKLQGDEWARAASALADDVWGGIDASNKRLLGARDQVGKVYEGADDVGGDVEEAYRLADEAARSFDKAISSYKDLTAQEMSAVAHGIQRSAEARLREIKGTKVGADGMPIPESVKLDEINRVRMEANAQVQEAITPMASRFNDAVVSLKQGLAGLRMQAAEFRLRGADLKGKAGELRLAGVRAEGEIEAGVREGERIKGELGATLTGQLLASQEGRRQLLELSASLTTQGAQIRNAAILDSARLALEGKALTAQLVQQNPNTVVSIFQGLLALYSAQSAASGSTGFSTGGGGGGSGASPQAGGASPQGNKIKGFQETWASQRRQSSMGVGDPSSFGKKTAPRDVGGTAVGKRVMGSQGYDGSVST